MNFKILNMFNWQFVFVQSRFFWYSQFLKIIIGNFIRNDYFTTSASDRHYLGDDGDTPTVSATTTAIPETAKIGSFGAIGTYVDNTAETETSSWRLDDGGNGRAKLTLSFNYKDQLGNSTGSEKQIFTIDESGNRISMTFEFYDVASGITLSLSGS